MNRNVLEVKHLSTSFFTEKGEVKAVRDVSLEIPAGRITGIVGESGCGKSLTARSIMRLLRYPGKIVGGEVLLDGKELTGLSEKEMCALRGFEMSMIFQEPMTSLNPVMKAGVQVAETLRIHEHVSKEEARQRTLEMFASVGISDAEKRFHSYPHELSGGLRQRVMIAMAMICSPKLLIADEPTTALSVTVEAQILRLMKQLCKEKGTSVLLISHNLGVIAQLCDDVYVMYAGTVIEHTDIFSLFDRPLHPYTRGLLNTVRSLHGGEEILETIPGAVPNLLHMPAGCGFSPRCGQCKEACRELMPELKQTEPGHSVRCHLFQETKAESGSGYEGETV